MLETVKKETAAKVALIFFAIYLVWWLLLNFYFVRGAGYQLDYFTITYGLIAVWGSLWGLWIAKRWGGLKSIMGKAIVLLSLGLASQEFGQLAYSYYIYIRQIEVPYPSIGDIGFFGTIPFYILGITMIAKASGVTIGLKSLKSKIQALIIPSGTLLIAYFLFLQGYIIDWSNPLRVLLDFAYPLGDAIYVSLAILTYSLSRGVLGGAMKSKIRFILFALIVQFITDYIFLYQSSRGIWQVGGINDLMYLTSYFLMVMGLLQLKTAIDKIKDFAAK